MTNPVLFLDIDGVLNHRNCDWKRTGTKTLCPKACALLSDVIAKTDARIVLSSTWRRCDDHVRHLRRKRVIGRGISHKDWRTKELPPDIVAMVGDKPIYGGSVLRGTEIKEWLSRHPEVERYAIVDDDGDMLPEQLPNFVQTNTHVGLLPEHAARLIAILSGDTCARNDNIPNLSTVALSGE